MPDADLTGKTRAALDAHPDYERRGMSPLDDWYVCVGCKEEIETSAAHIESEFRAHQAAAVTAVVQGEVERLRERERDEAGAEVARLREQRRRLIRARNAALDERDEALARERDLRAAVAKVLRDLDLSPDARLAIMKPLHATHAHAADGECLPEPAPTPPALTVPCRAQQVDGRCDRMHDAWGRHIEPPALTVTREQVAAASTRQIRSLLSMSQIEPMLNALGVTAVDAPEVDRGRGRLVDYLDDEDPRGGHGQDEDTDGPETEVSRG